MGRFDHYRVGDHIHGGVFDSNGRCAGGRDLSELPTRRSEPSQDPRLKYLKDHTARLHELSARIAKLEPLIQAALEKVRRR